MEYRSKLEKYAKIYDKRLGTIQNGELFDPMLNRYDSILRFIARAVRCDCKRFIDLHPSKKQQLRAGINLCNTYLEHYNFSGKVMKVYRVDDWLDLLYHFTSAKFEYKTKNNGVYGNEPLVFEEENRYVLNNISFTSLDGDFNLLRELDELYMDVANNLALESYKRISSWEPKEFEDKFVNPRIEALKGVKECSVSGMDLSEICRVVQSEDVTAVISEYGSLNSEPRNIWEEIINLDFLPRSIAPIVAYFALSRRATEAVLSNRKINSGLSNVDEGDLNNPFSSSSYF